MPLTIVVRCAPRPASPAATAPPEPTGDPSITFDSPRLVIGRGDSAELRLPDPSVSHRHASVRARGAEWVLIDEGSTNGTFIQVPDEVRSRGFEQVRLAPQSPRVLRSGELIRVGRVWLEVRIEPAVMASARPAALATELALTLVARALAADGEDGRPRVWVEEGPDAGKELRLDPRRTYLVGRARESDLALEDADASRRHAELSCRGAEVLVQDLGSKAGATLAGQPLGAQPVPWTPGQQLAIGADRLQLSHSSVDALMELERSPDERMDPAERVEPPAPPAPEPGAEGEPAAEPEAKPAAAPSDAPARNEPAGASMEPRGWSITDGAVLLVSLGVLVLSVAGLVWLLGR